LFFLFLFLLMNHPSTPYKISCKQTVESVFTRMVIFLRVSLSFTKKPFP
jgi:hypothetical protein